MTTMTVLPHTSAAVERIFSQINRMKTKSISSLEPEMVKTGYLQSSLSPEKIKSRTNHRDDGGYSEEEIPRTTYKLKI